MWVVTHIQLDFVHSKTLHFTSLTILLWMPPLQKPPSFLRSYWVAWTSWLKHTKTFKAPGVIKMRCVYSTRKWKANIRVITCTPTTQAVSEFDWVLSDVICWLFPKIHRNQTSDCATSVTNDLYSLAVRHYAVAFGSWKRFIELFNLWCLAHGALQTVSSLLSLKLILYVMHKHTLAVLWAHWLLHVLYNWNES